MIFRVEYNKLIQIDKMEKEKLPKGPDISPLLNNSISISWEVIRKLPYYLEISKYSQLMYRIRSKVNNLWYRKYPIIPKSKQL